MTDKAYYKQDVAVEFTIVFQADVEGDTARSLSWDEVAEAAEEAVRSLIGRAVAGLASELRARRGPTSYGLYQGDHYVADLLAEKHIKVERPAAWEGK